LFVVFLRGRERGKMNVSENGMKAQSFSWQSLRTTGSRKAGEWILID